MRDVSQQIVANRFAARRQFPAHQFLHRERVGDVVRERREIIEPVRVGDELVVLHVLGDLFVAAMQITDVRRRLGDDLAVELEHETQNAVRGRMRRPHVEHHLFADVVARIFVAQLRVRRDDARDGIGRFDFARGKSHSGRSFMLASEPRGASAKVATAIVPRVDGPCRVALTNPSCQERLRCYLPGRARRPSGWGRTWQINFQPRLKCFSKRMKFSDAS